MTPNNDKAGTNPQSDAAPHTAPHSGATGHPSIAAPLDLNGIRKRCDAATPGPWTAVAPWVTAPRADNISSVRVLQARDGVLGEQQANANADFASHAREDIPALLAALAASEARADALEREVKRLNEKHTGFAETWTVPD